MSISVDWQKLNIIFQSRQDILDGIKRCADTPGKAALFNEIASHVFDKFQTPTEPDTKRRKIQEAPAGTVANAQDAGKEPVLLAVKEISVSVPQRKKFEICFTSGFLYARAPGTTTPVPGMIYSWNDIEYAFYLPVPDKAQVQHNYLLFPRGTCLPSKTNPPSQEPLVFTVPATAPKDGTISGSEASSASAVSDTYKTLFHWAINARLRSISSSTEIVSADPNKFQSVIRQSHRPNEKSVHVTGFRGSKDGYLFFLENGILWGYKKPLLFIPLKRIAAVSYTNILQITFNVVIEVFGEDGETTEELEFGMIDQQDYAGIDTYLKTKNLQDGSMAEQRKAKLQLAENKGKKGTDGEQNGDANGLTELERAQQDADQQMDDEEDEEEDEDFDPGSDGDSGGSGESDDDDDDDDDDDEDDEGEGGDGDDDEDGEDGEEEEGDEDGDEKPGLSLR